MVHVSYYNKYTGVTYNTQIMVNFYMRTTSSSPIHLDRSFRSSDISKDERHQFYN